MFEGTNTTGWAELYSGDIIGAAYTMYNTAFLGWFVAILFFIFQFMLYMKSRNLALNFITGAIFASLFLTQELLNELLIAPAAVSVMYVLLVIELAGIFIMAIMK